MEDAVRFRSEGMPFASVSSRLHRVRMTGLRPATKYYYRIGAAFLDHPVGYWMKASGIEWGDVHSFTTPGTAAESRFAVMNDTHAHWESFSPICAKLKSLGAPVTVWNGDFPPSLIRTEKDAIRIFLKPPIPEADYGADAPVLIVNGNHDFRGEWNRTRSQDIFLPHPDGVKDPKYSALVRNFAVRQGDIAMIGLDTGEDKPDWHPCFAGCAGFEPYRRLQAEWLKDQFKRPEIASAPYVVAFCHIPLYDSNPKANPGDRLEDWASWQKACSELWGPIFDANRVQLVIAAHVHAYRYDPPSPRRTWAQITGGGPKRVTTRRGHKGFPSVIEGIVYNGALEIRVHDVLAGKVEAVHRFAPRV
jgi:hypothetical protein